MSGILGRVKRWTWFLWWNWCNLFNGLCSGTIRVLYYVNVLFLKVIFILISLVLLVEISNSCVSEVAIDNTYLLSFAAQVLIILRAAYLLNKYFFLHISFFKKKDFIRNSWNIWNKYNFFILTETSGWEGVFYWFSNGRNAFEANYDDTKKYNSDRVLHELVTKFLQF